jgi:predicted aspartyl protease
MKLRSKLSLAIAIIINALLQPNGLAAVDEWQLGLDAYRQKKFAEAIKHFDVVIKTKPTARTAYYLALSCVQNGNLARGKQLFQYIISVFPKSTEASLSTSAMTKLTGGAVSKEAPGTSPEDSTSHITPTSGQYNDKRIVHSHEQYQKELATIPAQTRIPVTSGGAGGATVLIGSINRQQFYFRNSSNWETYLSLEDLARARIAAPKGPTDGLEDEKPVWKSALELTIGGIKRKVPVSIFKEHGGYPELGRAFFEGLSANQEGGDLVIRKSTAMAKSPVELTDQYQKEYAKLPDTTEIKFRSGEHGHMLVDAQVNGRPMQCWFDTGANAYFGLNNLRQAGLPIPKGDPDTATRGWAGKPVSAWNITVPVKLGGITRVIPALVSEEWDKPPLIGQEFLRDYQYSIDSGGGRMTLTKKEFHKAKSSAPVHSLYDVPCLVEHDREFVTLVINGRRCDHVLIDTGAAMTILSEPMAASLGIEIPASAPTYVGVGVGGEFRMREVEADVSLGPVSKRGFPIRIGGKAGSAIGQDFMSGWRFSVDRDAKLLRFFH